MITDQLAAAIQRGLDAGCTPSEIHLRTGASERAIKSVASGAWQRQKERQAWKAEQAAKRALERAAASGDPTKREIAEGGAWLARLRLGAKQRCPGCGGKVLMPCLACGLRERVA